MRKRGMVGGKELGGHLVGAGREGVRGIGGKGRGTIGVKVTEREMGREEGRRVVKRRGGTGAGREKEGQGGYLGCE